MKTLKQFKNEVNAACMKVDPEPEHGATAYLDVVELLVATRTIAPGDDIEVCRDIVLDYMSGPTE